MCNWRDRIADLQLLLNYLDNAWHAARPECNRLCCFSLRLLFKSSGSPPPPPACFPNHPNIKILIVCFLMNFGSTVFPVGLPMRFPHRSKPSELTAYGYYLRLAADQTPTFRICTNRTFRNHLFLIFFQMFFWLKKV